MDRRRILNAGFVLGGALAVPAIGRAQSAPAVVTRDGMRPQMPHGVQSGDPRADAALIWTRSDRPARLWVDWSTTASFANATRVRGPIRMSPRSVDRNRADSEMLPPAPSPRP